MENKPMSILLSEVKNGIVGLLTQSGLPIYIGEMLLKDILNEVSQISNQVQEREYQEYMKNEQERQKEIDNKKEEPKADE